MSRVSFSPSSPPLSLLDCRTTTVHLTFFRSLLPSIIGFLLNTLLILFTHRQFIFLRTTRFLECRLKLLRETAQICNTIHLHIFQELSSDTCRHAVTDTTTSFLSAFALDFCERHQTDTSSKSPNSDRSSHNDILIEVELRLCCWPSPLHLCWRNSSESSRHNDRKESKQEFHRSAGLLLELKYEDVVRRTAIVALNVVITGSLILLMPHSKGHGRFATTVS
mmetsp:Transcript_1392/g.1929  ORF Transcript_1392/g.1929 Transcript_1392/m.1929 type:complete len:222 (+) Transcript_1392:183-848(+)